MPCRDYMDDVRSGPDPQIAELKARCDKLSRIACRALTHIEESEDGLEVLVLKDPEVQEWWTAHKEADRKAAQEHERQRAARVEKDRLARIKKETLAQLSPDQKKALGIK
jgi:hypothetical protein